MSKYHTLAIETASAITIAIVIAIVALAVTYWLVIG